jgi:hypothetical protein
VATSPTQPAGSTSTDVVKPVIKQTPLRKPPPLPPQPPTQYGVVRQVQTDEIKKGLAVTFVFSALPPPNATLKTTWYYNNKPLGETTKKRGLTVAAAVRSSSPLPPGYWRCTLRVKLGNGEWKEVQEARLRLQ